jgi:beta-lactamase superfamily II metal-dependent hydrolase
VKLTVFNADDGDCLLLSSSDGHHALVDGGRRRTFLTATWPMLEGFARRGEAVDLVVVSHIDADHIEGILWLLKNVAAWTVFDYQRGDGGNPGAPRPSTPRPPEIRKIWHNSWRAQLGDLAGEIEARTSRITRDLTAAGVDAASLPEPAADLVEALQGLAESIPQGLALLRTIDLETRIPRNDPFAELVLLRPRRPHVEKLGRTELTVIGPARKHLETLREEWRKWLATPAGQAAASEEASADGGGPIGTGIWLGGRSGTLTEPQQAQVTVDALVTAAEIIRSTDPSSVTPPNRASITLLAEEEGRTCLLTGDANEEEILEGLQAAGRLRDGPFWCNVVKVQHHGSEHNFSETFGTRVLADQYVFCGDGAHGNPEPSVVKTLIETRLAGDPRPFTIWFNTTPERTREKRQPAMKRAVDEALRAARRHRGKITVKQLPEPRRFHAIDV